GAAARWQGFARLQIIARTRLGTGLANPSEWGLAKPIQARLRRCSEEMPGTMRGLANPWRLPTLHSPFGETEKGTGGALAEVKQPGGRSVGYATDATASASVEPFPLSAAPP